jgi:endonuclease/exonuclease/phosphatase family metal-dependent hydrolase
MNRTSARRLIAAFLALTALAAIAPVAEAAKKGKSKKPSTNVSAMTRNLYLGTDLIPIALAPNQAAFEAAASAGYAQVKATDFPARAKLIAREVKRTKPDLIGLQETALWRTGPKDGAATRAGDVQIDYLAILRKALKAAKLKYTVARVTNEADIEGPLQEPMDIRLTMRDVVLVKKRKGLKIRKRGGGNYTTNLSIPTVVGTFTSRRGFAFADLSLHGKRFRFVDTHLEAYGDNFRTPQAQQLVGPGGAAAKKGRVILVGDMNSDPNGSEPNAFNTLIAAGFIDTWARLHPGDPGLTSGLGADLKDPPKPNPFDDSRIDHVLYKGKIRPLRSTITGKNPANSRTSSGLWTSDHAGVVTKFKLK